jgi:hypothetical protein
MIFDPIVALKVTTYPDQINKTLFLVKFLQMDMSHPYPECGDILFQMCLKNTVFFSPLVPVEKGLSGLGTITSALEILIKFVTTIGYALDFVLRK